MRPHKESLKAPGSLVLDGTSVPIWNWCSSGKTNFSGKHKRAGFNHQVICTLDGRLLVITNPLPGARHEAHVFRAHKPDELLDSSTLADKGYVGLTNNRVLNRLRSVVERVIAHVKTWRILHTGFRRLLRSYGRVFSSGAGAVFLVAGGNFEQASKYPVRLRVFPKQFLAGF